MVVNRPKVGNGEPHYRSLVKLRGDCTGQWQHLFGDPTYYFVAVDGIGEDGAFSGDDGDYGSCDGDDFSGAYDGNGDDLCKFIELIILLPSARSGSVSTFLLSDGENPIIRPSMIFP